MFLFDSVSSSKNRQQSSLIGTKVATWFQHSFDRLTWSLAVYSVLVGDREVTRKVCQQKHHVILPYVSVCYNRLCFVVVCSHIYMISYHV